MVLESHSPPRSTLLRCCAVKPRLRKKSCALSLASVGQSLCTARAGKLFQRIDQHGAGALPGGRRMHVEQVDRLIIGERREAHGRAVHGGDQGELVAEPPRELLLVIGSRSPGCLLSLAVIVRGQLLDAGAEDLRKQRRVLDEERAQRELRMARAIIWRIVRLRELAKIRLTPSGSISPIIEVLVVNLFATSSIAATASTLMPQSTS